MQWSKQVESDYGLDRPTFNLVVITAKKLLNEALDPEADEYSPTRLAELVADELERWDWLNDPDHIIWDIAVETCLEEAILEDDFEQDFEFGDWQEDEV